MPKQEYSQAIDPTPSLQQLWEMIRGFQVSQLIHVTAKRSACVAKTAHGVGVQEQSMHSRHEGEGSGPPYS
jgi:hypothetical protein